MSVARHDPLFDRPRPIGISLKQFFVVIGLDHQRVHLAQTLHQHFRGVTQISDETESAISGVEQKSDRIHGIVRNRKGQYADIANRKFSSSAKYPPITMLIEGGVASHRLGG